MKNFKYKVARRIVASRKRAEARRDKIGISVLFSFAIIIVVSILSSY